MKFVVFVAILVLFLFELSVLLYCNYIWNRSHPSIIRNANQIVKTVIIQHGDYPLLITGILRCNFRIIGAIHDYDYVGDFDGFWWWNHVG